METIQQEKKRQMHSVSFIIDRSKGSPNIEVRACKSPMGNPIVEVEVAMHSEKLGLTGDDICETIFPGDLAVGIRGYCADLDNVPIDVY